MPSFDVLDNIELYLRTGTYPPDSNTTAKHAIRAASRPFVYKDDCLWRPNGGRLLCVVRSEEEAREILTRFHDNNDHAGQKKMLAKIRVSYYLFRVTIAVKEWIQNCATCQTRLSEARPQSCLAYGCASNSALNHDITFHRFPRDPDIRARWLTVAQRDEASVGSTSCLCSRHFEQGSFQVEVNGRLTLRTDAVPTIMTVTLQDQEVPVSENVDIFHNVTVEDLIAVSTATDSRELSEPQKLPVELSESSVVHLESSAELPEHQYCLTFPDNRTYQNGREGLMKKPVTEKCFILYDQISRYLSHKMYPICSKQRKSVIRRTARRFTLIDGVLMSTKFSPPVKVPRTREEVNSILRQFHDNQGHYGHGICHRAITKHFHWGSLSRDLAQWILNCPICRRKTKRKTLKCSVYNCTNHCGPVERGLGLTFHMFPIHDPALLARWLKSLGRPHWQPMLWSSVCSAHFTESCFDRSGETVTLHPDATPTLFLYNDPLTSTKAKTRPAILDEVTTQDQAFFAKYDAVERYLCNKIYPPGLTYVEKNTFRRFCKKFTMKEERLVVMFGRRERLVLRSREEVEEVLEEYHNELNHLDTRKCLRLLNDRFFWKTMRPDVVRWIDSCSECSSAKKIKTETYIQEDGPNSDDMDDDDGLEDEQSAATSGRSLRKRACAKKKQPVRSKLHSSSSPKTASPGNRVWAVRGTQLQSPDDTCSATAQDGVLFQIIPQTQGTETDQEETVSGSHALKRKRESESGSDSKMRSLARNRTVVPAPPLSVRPGVVQVRTVVQRCSQAKVHIKSASDEGDALWTEIQEGMVVYVCFFQRATCKLVEKMANTLLNAKLFQNSDKQPSSILELPGSVLLIPQDSLLGDLATRNRIRYGGPARKAAQLYNKLVTACAKVMARSAKCSVAGMSVEHGLYGQHQEVVMTSLEPMTHLLEF